MNLIQKSVRIIRKEGIKKFISEAFRWTKEKLYDNLFLLPVSIKVKHFRPDNIEEGIKFAYSSCARILKPCQIKSEIRELLRIFIKHKPKRIMEIGTGRGGTLFLFAKFAPEDAKIISIDLPGGPLRGGYSLWKILLFKAFAKNKQIICPLKMDSHDRKTLEKVKKILGNEKLDFLFIDADHTYKGVKKDFEMYGPLVRRGGIIAFHDIVPGPTENVGGVPKFWSKIKNNYKYLEIVESRSQKWAGIGVIFV